MMVSAQKVAAILRKSGLVSAKYESSRMVRGYRTRVRDGFTCENSGENLTIVRVSYWGVNEPQNIDRIATALAEAGLPVEVGTLRNVVYVRQNQN